MPHLFHKLLKTNSIPTDSKKQGGFLGSSQYDDSAHVAVMGHKPGGWFLSDDGECLAPATYKMSSYVRASHAITCSLVGMNCVVELEIFMTQHPLRRPTGLRCAKSNFRAKVVLWLSQVLEGFAKLLLAVSFCLSLSLSVSLCLSLSFAFLRIYVCTYLDSLSLHHPFRFHALFLPGLWHLMTHNPKDREHNRDRPAGSEQPRMSRYDSLFFIKNNC